MANLFGDVRAAYSLRRYWSDFWHRLTYRTYVGVAKAAADVTGLVPRGSIAYRAWVNLAVFFCSGSLHVLSVRNMGFRCGYMEELHWYLLNFGAVMGECFVLWLAEGRVPQGKASGRVYRALGYFWVFSFQFWSLPYLYFPKVLCFPLNR